MDSARHVSKRIFNLRSLRDMASYDVASTIHHSQKHYPPLPGLMDTARHVIKGILNPRSLSYVASYEVASTIRQSLGDGWDDVEKLWSGEEGYAAGACTRPLSG